MAANMEVLALDPSTAWSAKRRAGPLAIEILDGTVLVTVEGDFADHVLAAGEVFQGPPRRRVAATGISPSRIRVSPAEATTIERLAGRRPGHVARHLFGGALIVAVWLSLWAWAAMGVVAPLSGMPPAEGTVTANVAS